MINTDLRKILQDSEDDGELTNLVPLINQLQDYVDNFSVHAMNNSESSFLMGKLEAYKQVIEYLKNASPIKY